MHPLVDTSRRKSNELLSSALSPRAVLEQKIWDVNEGNKRVNGHPAEYVAQHLRHPVEELFPEEGTCVYIGDSWQRLDRKGVTIVDYEFGPVAEFQDERASYLSRLDQRLWDVESRMRFKDHVLDPHKEAIQQFLEREIPLARTLFQEAEKGDLAAYKEVVERFLAMKQRIEGEIARETNGAERDPSASMDTRVRDLWYAAVHGSRALDVLDWETELRLPYERYAESLPDRLSEEPRAAALKKKRQELIESIRFEKTAKEAEVVKAMFPFLPFPPESFDRFVAFWSISTYAMEHLDEEDFSSYWKEIDRVLKPGGKAYIFPLFQGSEYEMEHSLRSYETSHPHVRHWYENVMDGEMLVIEKMLTRIY
jgi:SAM-dependent methyltransferase